MLEHLNKVMFCRFSIRFF